MKPKDLKSSFTWDTRKVLIQDRVWYIPEYYDRYKEFTFPGWSHSDLFGNEKPVYIEYCSGNGTWIAEKAKSSPDVNWVAVEIQFKRVRKIWSKLKNLLLSNLMVVCGEALVTTQQYMPTESVSAAFINFPDPWPKRRHAKHRIISPAFVQELWRILKTGSLMTFVTDDEDYSQLAIEMFTQHPGFISLYPDPFYSQELAGYGSSFFEELWRGKGRKIRYHQFKRSEL